jgi:hypothetical protein
MEIKPHLTDAELAEFVSDPSRGPGTHLQFCDDCLDAVSGMRKMVAEMRATGVEPDEFWIKQRAAVRTKIAAVPLQAPRTLPRLAWAGAAGLLALVGLLLSNGTNPTKATPVQQQSVIDQDHELLMAVERVMRSSGPEALEPASYLVVEVNQDLQSASIKNKKEHSHEN